MNFSFLIETIRMCGWLILWIFRYKNIVNCFNEGLTEYCLPLFRRMVRIQFKTNSTNKNVNSKTLRSKQIDKPQSIILLTFKFKNIIGFDWSISLLLKFFYYLRFSVCFLPYSCSLDDIWEQVSENILYTLIIER